MSWLTDMGYETYAQWVAANPNHDLDVVTDDEPADPFADAEL